MESGCSDAWNPLSWRSEVPSLHPHDPDLGVSGSSRRCKRWRHRCTTSCLRRTRRHLCRSEERSRARRPIHRESPDRSHSRSVADLVGRCSRRCSATVFGATAASAETAPTALRSRKQPDGARHAGNDELRPAPDEHVGRSAQSKARRLLQLARFTYSKSNGCPLIPDLGGAIQFAIFPGS